jgi:hypothetical protein
LNDKPILAEFANQVLQELISQEEVEDESRFRHELFTQWVIDTLIEAGELEDGLTCYYRATGLEVSGYGVSDDDETLDLFVTVFRQDDSLPTLSRTEAEAVWKRARNFLDRSFRDLHLKLEEASPAFDMALRIHGLRGFLSRVRIFLITDCLTTVDQGREEDVDGIRTTYHLWDLRRLYRCVTSGERLEAIEIDFVERFGRALPCLGAGEVRGEYASHLLIFPGDLLAALYGEYGGRLLELNVRSFLQVRGKVNQGIRRTLMEHPERFLAYNNGISATASEVDVRQLPEGGLGITRMKDLQIVNGGQTTASIYHVATRDKRDMSGVQVQAKLTVVPAQRLPELVPLISRYANTQNKVNEADFSANDPFHVKVEGLSRTVWAPAADGTQRQTKWFYERARGQYQDAIAREGTPAKQKAFKGTYPINQKFTKTDLAKFENTWNCLPHTVSQGAEKNFRAYMLQRSEARPEEVDQIYFRQLVAKAIMFRAAERIVSRHPESGYRANIVTYSLAYIVRKTGQRIDLDRIWQQQAIGPQLSQTIERVSLRVRAAITSAPGGRNVTEWCKKDECWKRIEALEISLHDELEWELLPVGDERNKPRKATQRAPRITDEDLLNISRVAMIPARTWEKIAIWASQMQFLEPAQRELALVLARLAKQRKDPTVRQAQDALVMLREAEGLGFQLGNVA